MAIDTTVGGASANSYASVAEADAYNSQRGNSSWAGLTLADKEAALINAMDYLRATYDQSWKGSRVTDTQALAWPRSDVCVDGKTVPSDVVPTDIKNAQIQLALKSSTGTILLEDSDQTVKREKVDVLEVEYANGSTAGTRFNFVSGLLSPYVDGFTGSSNFTTAQLERV